MEDTEPASSGEFVVDIDLTVEEYKPLDVQALHYRHEHFKVGDKNKDAFINAAELAGSHNKQAWFAILSEGIEPLITRLDLNKDNKLEAPEYRKIYNKISKMGHHSDQHFEGVDANKYGFLDLTEFTAHAGQKSPISKAASRKRIY